MHTPSIRTLTALAYERGEEFDPATTPTPALLEFLSITATATPIIAGEPESRQRDRSAKAPFAAVPDWFSACDLVDPPIAGKPVAVIHGELL